MDLVSCSVVSDSLQPHGLWPTRLLCPWGFSRQEDWSGLLLPYPADLPNPGIEPGSSTLQEDSTIWANIFQQTFKCLCWLSPHPNSRFVPPTVEVSGNLGQNDPGGIFDTSFYYSPHRIHQHLDAPSKYIQNLMPSHFLPATTMAPSHVICCWISAVTPSVYIACPTIRQPHGPVQISLRSHYFPSDSPRTYHLKVSKVLWGPLWHEAVPSPHHFYFSDFYPLLSLHSSPPACSAGSTLSATWRLCLFYMEPSSRIATWLFLYLLWVCLNVTCSVGFPDYPI